MRRPLVALVLTLTLILVAAGCSSDDGDDTLIIGSKLDTEAQLLAHLMGSVLEDRGYEVRKQMRLGSTDIIRKALLGGSIDVYWEFTGTALGFLDNPPIGDPVQAYETAKRLDAEKGVTWLPAAAMNDTYALAVADTGPVSARTLTDLTAFVQANPDTALCADPEGGFREDVLPAVAQSYGLAFSNVRQLGQSLIPPAVADGQCAVGIVYSTSALIVKHKMRVVEDDKQGFGAYTPAPTLLTERTSRWPSLAEDIAGLTAALDTPTITRLNAEVEIDGRPAEDVADDFLRSQGLLSKEG